MPRVRTHADGRCCHRAWVASRCPAREAVILPRQNPCSPHEGPVLLRWHHEGHRSPTSIRGVPFDNSSIANRVANGEVKSRPWMLSAAASGQKTWWNEWTAGFAFLLRGLHQRSGSLSFLAITVANALRLFGPVLVLPLCLSNIGFNLLLIDGEGDLDVLVAVLEGQTEPVQIEPEPDGEGNQHEHSKHQFTHEYTPLWEQAAP